MISSITYNLKNLFQFNGRDRRRIYWHYFIFVILINLLVLAYAALPTIFAVVADVGQNAAGKSSEAVESAVLEQLIAAGLLTSLTKYGLGLGLANIVLLCAAVVRRVQDAGLPAMLVITPVGLQLLWMYFSYGQLKQLENTSQAVVSASGTAGSQIAKVEPGMVAQDLIGWVVIIILVVIGMLKSRAAANI